MSCGANYIVPGADPCGGGGGLIGVTSINNLTGDLQMGSSDGTILVTATVDAGLDIIAGDPFIGQFFMSDNIALPSGLTPITWDLSAPLNNVSGYVSNPDINGSFTVQKPGAYQIDFTIVVNGNAAAWPEYMRTAYITVNRSGSAGYYTQTQYAPPGLNHTISVSAVIALAAGDTFRAYYEGTNTVGTPVAVPFQGTIVGDAGIGTNICWRFIKPI